MRQRFPAAVAAALGVLLLVAARKHEQDPVFSQINEIAHSVASISGLTEQHAVPYDTISKKHLRQFLRKRIKKTLRPDEIRADELALKMFGLVPQSFDLKKSTLDLLAEQAAAFYDYDQKKLFLLEGSPLNEEVTTLAHELSHALADQHFNLARYMDESPSNDDENLAHTAVVEGQASWLMFAYELAHEGKPPVPTPEMLKAIEDSSDTSSTEYPVLKASPLYIQQSLLFPYSEGTRFFDAVFRRLGKIAFTQVFTRAPVASSQILHPEQYFSGEKPSIPELPKLDLGEGEEEVAQGSVGEFDHRMLLWQYVGQAKGFALATHLKGAQFRVTAREKARRPVFEYVSRWDSEGSAREYFAAYKQVLRNKWKRCEPASETADVFSGTGDSGFFLTHLRQDTLVSVEGIENPAVWANLKISLGGRKPVGLQAKLN